MVLSLGIQELSIQGADMMGISMDPSLAIPPSDVKVLEGHKSEVCVCAWSPADSLLASGSGDSTARIWDVADEPSTSSDASVNKGVQNVVALRHLKGQTKSKDVTAVDWNLDGKLLATGAYDGVARIWSKDGTLKSTLNQHRGPIFAVKWNKTGDYLLSGSVDETAVVWNARTGDLEQQFAFHTGPVLDVDWRCNVSFATCSTDNMIYVCNIGLNRPLKSFCGHQAEVNTVKWDSTGTFLASCSDDCTAKVWSMKQNMYLHDLRGHEKEVYSVNWSPTGPGSSNPNKKSILASASFDSTIKLWDAEFGSLLYSLNGHREAVYTVAFSPDGEYLASGSLDKCVNIWSVKEGKIVKTYTGNSGVFEVCWNREGNKVAASFSNNVVCVLDVRM